MTDAHAGPALSLASSGECDETRLKKRKRHRFKATCHACQKSKSKCTREEESSSESCERCRKRGEECTYDEVSLPSKTEPAILRMLNAHEARIKKLEEQLARLSDAPASLPSIHDGNSSAPSNTSILPLGPAQAAREPTNTLHAIELLEGIALGRSQQYDALGLNKELSTRAGSEDLEADLHPSGPHWTSIYDTSGVHVQWSQCLQAVPPWPVCDAMVAYFFSEISYVYRILHTPTFMGEYAQFKSYLRSRSMESPKLDQAWLSTMYMVLAMAFSTAPKAHSVFLQHGLDPSVLAKDCFEAAHSALEASKWTTRPQARAMQAILLRMAYWRPGAPDAGSSFFVWAAAAIRVGQLLKLHRLGKDRLVMPPSDSAWPTVACTLRRQLALRLWWWAVAQDWMFSTVDGIECVALGSFDSEMPADVDESELGLSLELPLHSAEYMSDYSYTTAGHFVVAHFQIAAAKISRQHPNMSYDIVLELARGLQSELDKVERRVTPPASNLQVFHKDLLRAILHNRLLRLHRPFFLKGYQSEGASPERYEPSVQACLKSASAVCRALAAIGEAGHSATLWFVPAYGITAFLVVFIHLMGKETRGQDASSELADIMAVRSFYIAGSNMHETARGHAASASARKVCHIIEALLSARTDRGGTGRDLSQMATELFKQVSTGITAGPSRAPTPEASGVADASQTQQLHGETLPNLPTAFPTLLLFGDPDNPSVPGFISDFDAEASRSAILSLSTVGPDHDMMAFDDFSAIFDNLDSF